MSQTRYLIIHKTEWDRLKRRQSSDREAEKNDNLKSSIEQSQNWIKMWPDTVQGHVHQLQKQKEVEHAQQIESVRKFVSRKKQEIKMESIKKARDMIFEDSCYGRQLLSALIESKTLEEREQQELFQKRIKQTADVQKQNESKTSSLQNASEMESIEIRTKLQKKQRDLEVARINQAMAKTQKENMVKEREKEKNEMILDDLVQNQLLEKGTNIKVNLEKHLINKYQAYRNEMKKLQTKRDEEDERKREICRKHNDILRNREKHILNEDEMLEISVKKGITRLKKDEKTQENADIKQKTMKRCKRQSLDDENKLLADIQHQLRLQENSKYVCCRQSIISNPCNAQKNNSGKAAILYPTKKRDLLDDLKKREKEPTPWSALKRTHEQFDQYASEILRQCRYKHMARRVINDYKKINCLDEKSLPVLNY